MSGIRAQRDEAAAPEDSEKLFRTVFELAGSGKAILEPETGRYLRVNRKFCEMLGYTADELKQRTWVDVTHPDEREWQIASFRRNVDSRASSWSLEKRYVRKDGATIWTIVTGAVLTDASGNPAQVVSTAVDITEQRRAAEVAREAVEELREERRVLERFTAALSHDLRTPLAAIQVLAQTSARKAAEPKLKANLSRIVDNVGRADRLIQDLLDASRIRAGQPVETPLEQVDLPARARETLDDLASIHGDRFRLAAPPSLTGYWNAGGIRRILENLAQNAVKYGTPGSSVTVTIRAEDGWVLLSVHNLGEPLAAADLTMLFEDFHRGPDAGRRIGWGLGLAVVKAVCESLGGHAVVRSSATEGTTFEISLPRNETPPDSGPDLP